MVPRNQYIEIRRHKPQRKEPRDWPEYKTGRSTTAAARTFLKDSSSVWKRAGLL
jgi:hypothetical protein